jgi:hypothetical protein
LIRERWWGSSGRRVPEIAVEGDPAVPLEEALVLEDVSDVAALKGAFDEGRPVVVRAQEEAGVLEALARPEVAAVVVPRGKEELLELDLAKLTYG